MKKQSQNLLISREKFWFFKLKYLLIFDWENSKNVHYGKFQKFSIYQIFIIDKLMKWKNIWNISLKKIDNFENYQDSKKFQFSKSLYILSIRRI